MSQLSIFQPSQGDWLDDLFSAEDPDGLRYYQREAYDSIYERLQHVNSVLLVMATGLGKTQVFSAVAKHWKDGPVLCMAHRDELVTQARDRLEQMTGLLVEVEQGDNHASNRAQIVVGSVQSIMQPKRLAGMGKDRFSLVVADEGHHYVSRTWRRPLEFFSSSKKLLVTATPDRGDEKALGQICDEVAYVFDIEQGINAGYLVPIHGKEVILSELNLDGIDKSKGDLNQGQLDEEVLKVCEGVVRGTLDYEPNRQGVAFFPGVKSAEYAAAKFNELRPGSACFISGATDEDERRMLVKDFKAGRYQYLCNCAVAIEGFDAPSASLIIQATPTLSRARYTQMVGRGTRVLPGSVEHILGAEGAAERRAAIARSSKPDMVVLDFVGNGSKHSLCSLEDALGGNYTPEEVALAKKERKKGKGALQSLQEARAALIELARKAKVTVKMTSRPFDPFNVCGVVVSDQDRYAVRFGGKPAPPQLLQLLQMKGVPDEDLDGLSLKAARKLMDNLNDRRDKGLCTYKQLRQLSVRGITDKAITFDAARRGLDYLSSQGWGKAATYDPAKLNEALYRQRQAGED